jgi:phage gpG-like protein
MAWEQRGVLQNKAAMPPRSFLTIQKDGSSGIRLKQ